MKKNLNFYFFLFLFLLTSCSREDITKNEENQSTLARSSMSKSGGPTSKVSLGYLSFSKWFPNTWNDIQYEDLTHIVMCFLSPASATDPTIIYSGDSHDFDNYPLSQKDFFGYANELVPKAHAKGVKVMFALHDYSNGTKMRGIFANENLRAAFINNLITICKNHDFDGIDLDYEYPSSQSDGIGIKNFIIDLHNAAQANINKPFSITMALGYGAFAGQYLDLSTLNNYCDFYNIMTYDYDATWTSYFGFNAPLYKEASQQFTNQNCDASMQYYNLQRGVPKDKLVLGLPFYGYRYNNYTSLYAQKPTNNGDGLQYRNIYSDYMNKPEWARRWSPSSQVPYLVNQSTSQMITYDDEISIAAKCDYASANAYRGVMCWELSRGFIQGKSPSMPLLKIMGDKVLRNNSYGSTGLESGYICKIATMLDPNKVLDVNGELSIDGTQCVMWFYKNSNNQKWKLTKLPNGNYKLNPLHAPSKALNVLGGANANNSAVDISTDNGSNAQQWTITKLSSNIYTLMPACAPGKILNIPYSDPSNGKIVNIYQNNAGYNQKWIITRLE
ncbi:Chitinase, GH18 family [Chryseobacterium sp. RU37D]|uniref:glycosyl hydrolase family 18 protein n=1 Tax=Chryseobacterium sp. RU37D TaxID=1907397 RepID=UPI000956E044|nr:glycosyl hydrolase family 18 protein [Chryseobacterium sp. RU37D]SIQ89244.1 Chitinase, GH18 family [Chryseobacterium sp. RU37D]